MSVILLIVSAGLVLASDCLEISHSAELQTNRKLFTDKLKDIEKRSQESRSEAVRTLPNNQYKSRVRKNLVKDIGRRERVRVMVVVDITQNTLESNQHIKQKGAIGAEMIAAFIARPETNKEKVNKYEPEFHLAAC